MSEKCHRTGKVIHASRGKADAHLRNLVARTGYVGESYPCLFCHGWHVGRQKKSAHKNKYRLPPGR
jgi:hypothetical protein